MGIDGIIVPSINSKKDAIEIVNYCLYPPHGKRGAGLYRAQNYGIGFEDYKKRLNDIVIVAQIEHINAVNNIEEILSVDRVDSIIIGPYDLSSSMGFPGEYNRDDVQNALKKVEKIC